MTDQRVQSTFICTKKSKDACQKEFLESRPELEYVRVPGDGNCFFRSLAAYYERTGEQIVGITDPTDFEELRRYIVHRFGEQIAQDDELREIFLPALNERPINIILSELATSCVWDVPVFEMMVERVPSILNINLRIFRINSDKGKYTVTESLYTPRDERFNKNRTTICIFLASSHYGLIFPKNRKLSQGQKNMNAAIAASLQNIEITEVTHRQKQMNNNAKLAVNIAKLNIVNKKPLKTRKKPTVGVLPVRVLSNYSNSSVVSPASPASPVSWNNGMNIEEIQQEYPYKKYTIKDIKEYLNVFNIDYNAKSKKDELYGTFIWKMKEDINERTRNTLQTKKQTKKFAAKESARKEARQARRTLKQSKK